MRLALVALASLVMASPAFANALTLGGELGGRPIQVELTEPAHGAVAGRYTFTDDGADIPLRPVSVDGDVWTLAEEAPCTEGTCIADDEGVVQDPPIAAIWEIAYDADTYIGTATRTSSGVKAKAVPFELYTIAWRKFTDPATAFDLHDRSARLSYDETLPLDWARAPIEMLLLDIDLDPGAMMESHGIEWSYVTDPRSNLTFPRIMTDEGPFESLGPVLNAHFNRMSLSALECKAFRYASYGMNENFDGLGGHAAGYEDEAVTLTHLSPTLVSWSQSGSLYCQGAHPYNHFDNYTYDVATAAPLDWRQVFSAFVPRPWFSPLDEVADVETALADPESYTWGPDAELIDYIQQNRPRDILDAELEEFCGTDEAIAEQLSLRAIGEDEIMFTLSGFPHVSSVCNGDLFSARLADLTPFLAPTARDYFPVLGGKPQQ